MPNHLSLYRHVQACSRFLALIAFLLIGSLTLLSACKSSASTPAVQRVEPTTNVDPFLREQGLFQLETLQRWVALLPPSQEQYRVYQRALTSDQQALEAARSDDACRALLHTMDQQIQAIQVPGLKAEASAQERQLAQQSSAWGQDHWYHDPYDHATYPLAYEYGSEGAAGLAQDELAGAQTLADYQQAVKDMAMYLTNLQAYQANANDNTPWNQVHATDLQLMRHYETLQQKVVVVSLGDQALRVYEHGSLVKAFQVTTGQPNRPSLPGFWQIERKLSPTTFKSDEPRTSPYWYPETPINYAMLYHSGGYFLHDSWWRADYGFGTQFPHTDTSGDSFSFTGSHGCINLARSDAAWLYAFVDTSTPVIVY